MKALAGISILALMATLSPAANSPARPVTAAHAFAATCFCKLSKDNLSGKTSATGVFMELTTEVNHSYTGLTQQSEANQENCRVRCQTVAGGYVKSLSVAAAACAAGVPHNSDIRAYSAAGTKAYRQAQPIGVLNNTPPQTVTTCTCPAGWLSNTTNTPGGVTADGRCKKLAGKPISISPIPPNGTQIGTWGFTWGDELWAYGTSANGGEANCVTSVTAPAMCQFF